MIGNLDSHASTSCGKEENSVMKVDKSALIFLVMLVCISAIAYLPLVNKFGYYNDDWYLMYDAHTQGAQFFHEIFSGDRPGRAYAMVPLFSLFGLNPLYYNLAAYLFRVMGGISLFWALRMLWPKKYFLTTTTPVLFTIYPGFLSQINAIDYQSHLLALFFALLSIALTIKSIVVDHRIQRAFLILGSVLTGWAYLSQIEYFIGVEVFRFACIFMLVWRRNTTFRDRILNAVLTWFPFFTVPGGFLLWRLFFFQVERRATDIEFQIGQLFISPLTGLWWLVYLIQDVFNVTLVVWGLPLYLLAFNLRLREILIGIGLSILAVFLFIAGIRWVWKNKFESEDGLINPSGMHEELWVSLLTIFGGLIPVIVANRHIVLPDYSRYTLIASIGAVILLTAIIERLSMPVWRIGVVCFFVAVAVLTHYGNSVKAAAETRALRDFWWQVAWRIPDIKSGTTLIANYPVGAIQEDYFVWGPANLIYYPEKQNEIPIKIKLPAAVLTDAAVLQILAQKGEETPLRRGNELTRNFGNILIMTQAGENSCVRLIDGNSPNLSVRDPHRILLIASNSKLGNIIASAEESVPPTSIFGNEPEHDWCFYYEKADLARQRGDWDQVVRLGVEAKKLDLHPNDQIEWMPFLQAYAFLDNQKQVREISTRINTEAFYKEQACSYLNSMEDYGYPLSLEMQNYVSELFCQ
jgi:hypothetical protein